MKTTKLCRECGQPVSPDALLGLCPQCMMKAGLPASSRPTIAISPDAFVEGPETETKSFIPGTRLGYIGDYELLEEIARGGMGVVYKARQSSLKRIVAVKTIRSGQLANEVEVRRFHTEAEAAAQLQHPNIVAIHEIGEHQGQQYFSMDFVEGRNLAQAANGKPVAAHSAAEWLKTIAGAVQFAHQRGVLHRDLKPQNIMLDAAGRPRVMDFGLAKTLGGDSSVTNTGAVMGSPSYMSPEQALGRNDLVGPASDVYSLGAILYELLTGRPPFRGKSMMDTMSQVVNDEPPPPRSLNAEAPVDLESICLKCLEKDPARRYPTARELEADLGRFLDGEPVQARPANALRRTMSWFRRHRWVSSAAASLLILTLAGLAYGLWEQNKFLTSLNANPGLVKASGPRTAGAAGFQRVMWFWVVLLLFVSVFLAGYRRIQAVFRRKFKTRRPWNIIFWPLINSPVDVLPASARVVGRAARGVFCIVFGLNMAAKAIEAFVWERALPSGLSACFVFLFIYAGVNYLMSAARQQMQMPTGSRPEDRPAPSSSQAQVFWWGVIISLTGACILSAAQNFSKADLVTLGAGLFVAVSSVLGFFVLSRLSGSRLSGDLAGADLGSKRAGRGKRRWIKAPARIAAGGVAFVILLIDACIAVVNIGGNPDINPNPSHARNVFLCGLAAGFLPMLLVLEIRKPKKSCQLDDKPAPLSPEQLAPIHEALFTGRTKDALNLYVAATGARPDGRITALLILRKMEAELRQAHPEKFSAAALDRPVRDLGKWGAWVGGIILVAGLLYLFRNVAWFTAMLYGPLLGGLIRAATSKKLFGWSWAVRFLAWILGFVIALALFLAVFVHPEDEVAPHIGVRVLLSCGVIAGWLLVHLLLRKRKRS